MVDVVTALPPAYGQAAAEVGYEHSDQTVHEKAMGDASMSSVVGSKHDLMLSHVRDRRRGDSFDTYPK